VPNLEKKIQLRNKRLSILTSSTGALKQNIHFMDSIFEKKQTKVVMIITHLVMVWSDLVILNL